MAKNKIPLKIKTADIFKESAMRVLKNSESQLVKEEDSAELDIIVPIKEITSWSELKAELKTTHAARFNRILSQLPARDFMNYYIKILEYAEPKVTRKIGDGIEKEDNELIIVVKR